MRAPEPLLTVELRPPRRAASATPPREHWIDMYHAVRRLAQDDTFIFTTDSAVALAEEESVRHLKANLGEDADFSRLLPFLTTKHPLEYCLRFPERALEAGHRAVIILGGDRHEGPPRCVEHAAELRALVKERCPSLALGGWANPYREPGFQVELLKRQEGTTDFYLTQVVSHHDLAFVERFQREAERQELAMPGLFGVFYYRSGSPRTLGLLSEFLPVPREGLGRDFAAGRSPMQICAQTIISLRGLGVRRFYLCNLTPRQAPAGLAELRALAGIPGEPVRLTP